MSYPFENLTPEKFQEFCQALLTKEFQNMQCFPVAQPDGGRDALQWAFAESKREFVMFQVKFVRQPQSINDPHKWLLSIIEKEAPKVKQQIPRGAKQYLLLTNLRGTAHPGSGSIDTANKMLTQAMGIPSVCWWRDDLCRRLDNSWDLKWAYPELMTGPDLIRFIIEKGLSDGQERRTSAVRAFIKHQYSIDQEVKFKQVELQNKLLDLFVDVPIQPILGRRFAYYTRHSFVGRKMPLFDSSDSRDVEDFARFEVDPAQALPDYFNKTQDVRFHRYLYAHPAIISGTADLLLRAACQLNWPRVVLEGAPGHGKSTIAQYLCQVHRMRLLESQDEIQQLPAAHSTAPLRLPIKADLRDLASWLARRNPFTPEGDEIPANEWTKSLEGFLSALIRYQSGGIQFDAADLLAVAKISAMLIVFDGLDEVADIERRQEVVDEIVKGVDRLEANAASLQVVVTSRPAAFANSPGLPEDRFMYFGLDDLSMELIDEYAEKWLKARRLHERESAEVKKILKEKLTQPHLRDLARNPMQLAILLSLIHTRGTSLPDKRTALYDSYVELFFNREAEKSPIVRDNRDLLINIHRYLAWLLHGEVELGGGAEPGRRNGAIAAERLIKVLKEYLENEGHDPRLAETLFKGMVERVVALVSRVQGTYEFEVQPLREYFAARFLYETAPYSPPGAERRGTKPDRFDAIARDFYWLNVARFYAGCYSKGELASLIEGLQELVEDADYGLTGHPRILGATLLSDWVFSQYPKSVTEVVNLMLDGLGLRFVLTSCSERADRSSPVVLPQGCGKQELLDRCHSLLKQRPPLEYALDVIDLLKANATPAEVFPAWLGQTRKVRSRARTDWLEYGLHLGCLSTIDSEQLKDILSDQPFTPDRVDMLFRAERIDFLESDEATFSIAVKNIMDGHTQAIPSSRIQGTVDLLAHCLDVDRYAIAFRIPPNATLPLSAAWEHGGPEGFSQLRKANESTPPFAEIDRCSTLIAAAQEQSEKSASRWATELGPWDAIVEEGRRLWGNQWIFCHMANIAGGIKSATETCADCPDPFDDAKSVCRRSRYARLRAGTVAWWSKQFVAAQTTLDKLHISQVWLTWSSQRTVMQCLEQFDSVISRLETEEWTRFFDSVEHAMSLTSTQPGGRLLHLSADSLPESMSPRACAAVGLRTHGTTRLALYRKYLSNYQGDDLRILKFCQRCAIRLVGMQDPQRGDSLSMIARCFANGVVSDRFQYHNLLRRSRKDKIPLEHAIDIVKDADQYPAFLVAVAESRCREATARKIIPVSEVAKRDHWFKG